MMLTTNPRLSDDITELAVSLAGMISYTTNKKGAFKPTALSFQLYEDAEKDLIRAALLIRGAAQYARQAEMTVEGGA